LREEHGEATLVAPEDCEVRSKQGMSEQRNS